MIITVFSNVSAILGYKFEKEFIYFCLFTLQNLASNICFESPVASNTFDANVFCRVVDGSRILRWVQLSTPNFGKISKNNLLHDIEKILVRGRGVPINNSIFLRSPLIEDVSRTSEVFITFPNYMQKTYLNTFQRKRHAVSFLIDEV